MTIDAKYTELRLSICSQVEDYFSEEYPELVDHLRLTEIDGTALRAMRDTWVPHPIHSRNVGTLEDWRYQLQQYRISYNSRMELAIWYDDHLCALMLGKVSRRKLTLKITYLQGAYNIDQLIGLRMAIATTYAEAYASALDIAWVGVQDPYEGAEQLYRDNGFVESDPFDLNNDALFKNISD
ncbi:hypothetical protein L4C44_03255 [Vibrio satsumensis]|uniref:hypothetical protein n=1 Tax=Vibrio satsumensis TaxID=2910245 RepID=UPI003D1456D2